MTNTITRTFSTYHLTIVRLYLKDGAPQMEPLDEWDEEVVGVMSARAARKLAVTHHGGRLPAGCNVTYDLLSQDVYAMPVEQFKASATLVSTVLPDEGMDALADMLEDTAADDEIQF